MKPSSAQIQSIAEQELLKVKPCKEILNSIEKEKPVFNAGDKAVLKMFEKIYKK